MIAIKSETRMEDACSDSLEVDKCKVEGVEAEGKTEVDKQQENMKVNEQVKKKKSKTKNKKKKRGQNKKQGVMFQSKKQKNMSGNGNVRKNGTKLESVKAEKQTVGGGKAKTDGEETAGKNIKKPKKAKKKSTKDIKVHSEKMELTPLLNQETEGRTSHRDERTLYIRFPASLSVRDKAFLEPMVPSAVDIRFPRLSPASCAKFCYIEFKTKEETMKMKESFARIKIHGEAFYADFVGRKSKMYNEKEPRIVDPVRLYVGGLPRGVQATDMKAVFPTATRVIYKKASYRVNVSHAYLVYETHKEALRVFNASKDLKILGREVIVMFATYKDNAPSKNEELPAAPPAKKQKAADVKMEDGNDDGGTEMNTESENKGQGILAESDNT